MQRLIYGGRLRIQSLEFLGEQASFCGGSYPPMRRAERERGEVYRRRRIHHPWRGLHALNHGCESPDRHLAGERSSRLIRPLNPARPGDEGALPRRGISPYYTIAAEDSRDRGC